MIKIHIGPTGSLQGKDNMQFTRKRSYAVYKIDEDRA